MTAPENSGKGLTWKTARRNEWTKFRQGRGGEKFNIRFFYRKGILAKRDTEKDLRGKGESMSGDGGLFPSQRGIAEKKIKERSLAKKKLNNGAKRGCIWKMTCQVRTSPKLEEAGGLLGKDRLCLLQRTYYEKEPRKSIRGGKDYGG